MKRIKNKVAVLLLTAAMIMALLPAYEVTAYSYSDFHIGQTLEVNTGKTINVRSTPSTSASRLGQVSAKDQFRVVAKQYDAYGYGWMYVKFGSKYGYVRGDEGWFRPVSTAKQVYDYPTSMVGTVQVSVLNVRSTPLSTTYNNIIGTVTRGMTLNVTKYTTGGWLYFSGTSTNSSMKGYVSGNYVSVKPGTGSGSATQNTEKFTSTNGYTCTTNVEKVPIRKSGNTSAAVLAAVAKGKVLTIKAFSPNWYYVSATVNGKTVTGYVSRKYTTRQDLVSLMKLNKTYGTMKRIGKTYQLKVLGLENVSYTAVWSSSDSSIVSVDGNGVITANGLGTATIQCSVKVPTRTPQTRTCKVTVVQEQD
ncbi:MAG: SH3 domain-containing protein [Blautia sp.]|nr:SH3 domain-containing protein [Blautia sp.]